MLIKDPFSLNKFLNSESKTIIDKNTDIFETVVVYYSIKKKKEKSKENNKEKKPIMFITKALRCLEIIKT